MTPAQYEEMALYNIYMAQRAFLCSLGIGTLIELGFLLTEWWGFAVFGFFYVIFAFAFNLGLFLNNLIFLCFNSHHRLKLLAWTLLMPLNLPIAFYYIDIVFKQ